jgi:GNAT superfamily N-acetyltransferase
MNHPPELTLEFLERIEEAALNAWTAPRQMIYDGWVLRFAGGYTKRANAVTVRSDGRLPLAEKIDFCEKAYDRMGLPILFRLPDPWLSKTLNQALSDAGYEVFDPTLVLGRKLEPDLDRPNGCDIRAMTVEEWLGLRARLTQTSLSDWDLHGQILRLIVPEKILLGLFVNGEPAACGMGVVEGGLLGNFSIYTAAAFRGQGCARALMAALAGWGAAHKADYGYLQVEGDNIPALSLYDSLGFSRCYRYLYARKS